MGAVLRDYPIDDGKRAPIYHVHNAGLSDRHIEAPGCGAEPDRVRFARDGNASDLPIGGEVQHGDDARIARDERQVPRTIEIEPVGAARQPIDPSHLLKIPR
jgi:hypothetical protein